MRPAQSVSARRYLPKLRSRAYLDVGDYRSTVFLAGTGRSGTTWLEELINFRNDYRILFEPFHAHRVPLVAHWNYRQYLRPAERHDRYLGPARKILSGRVRDPWIDHQNRKHIARRRLVKDIRANLMLGWIRRQFPEIPIVLVLRHPCAVASSKLALGWDTVTGDFLSQPQLVQDHLHGVQRVICSARDNFERHIVTWCIENIVPLRQLVPGEIFVCFYEQFCRDPEREGRRLLTYLRGTIHPALLTAVRKPSALSRRESAIMTGGNLLDAWREHISEPQVQRAVELLSAFGLDRVYSSDSCPKVRGEEALGLF